MDLVKMVFEYSNTITVVVVLSIAVIAFVRGWIVPGLTHDRCVKERDKYLDAMVGAMDLAKRAATATTVALEQKKDV